MRVEAVVEAAAVVEAVAEVEAAAVVEAVAVVEAEAVVEAGEEERAVGRRSATAARPLPPQRATQNELSAGAAGRVSGQSARARESTHSATQRCMQGAVGLGRFSHRAQRRVKYLLRERCVGAHFLRNSISIHYFSKNINRVVSADTPPPCPCPHISGHIVNTHCVVGSVEHDRSTSACWCSNARIPPAAFICRARPSKARMQRLVGCRGFTQLGVFGRRQACRSCSEEP